MKKNGQDFKLGIVDSAGAFHIIVYAQKASLDLKSESEEISSPKTGKAKTSIPGLTSWEMSHDGFWGSSEKVFSYEGQLYTSDQLLLLLWKKREHIRVRYVEEDGWLLVEGEAEIKRITTTSTVDSLVKISVKLEGSGELEFTDPTSQSGHFVAAHKEGVLTLYAAEAPVADCTIAYNGTDLGVWHVGTSTVEFNLQGSFDVSLLSAKNSSGPMPGITFEDASRLHLVLRYRFENRSSIDQDDKWYIRPYWWNRWNLGDIVLHFNGGATLTLSTQYLQDQGDEVLMPSAPEQIDYVVIDGPQIQDCCDITSTTFRSLTLKQTSMSGAYGGDVELSQALACDLFVTLRNSSGVVQASGTISAGDTSVTLTYAQKIVSSSQIHFQFQDRNTDVSAPYSFSTAMDEDLSVHKVFYAYNATAQKMTVCCPSQLWPLTIKSGQTTIWSGMCTTPQTFTCSSATSLSAERGSYTFENVTNVDCWRIGSTFCFTKTTLFPTYLTLSGTRTGQVVPVLTGPDDAVTMTTVADGAEMESGVTQNFTFQGIIGGHDYNISCFATDNGDNTVTVRVALTNTFGELCTLPVSVFVLFGNSAAYQIEIEAGSSLASKTMDSSVLWQTPTAHALSSWVLSETLNFECHECVDITPSHYLYYPVLTLGIYDYADIGYYSTSHGTIEFKDDVFPKAQDKSETPRIPPSFKIANHMAKYTNSGSSTVPTLKVLSGPYAMQITPTLAQEASLVLMYYDGGEANIAVINTHDHIMSRYSAIGDVLPYMRVRQMRTTYALSPVYNAIPLYTVGQNRGGLRPGDPATVAGVDMKVYTGTTSAQSTQYAVVEFSETPTGPAISASCLYAHVYIKNTDDTDIPRVDS